MSTIINNEGFSHSNTLQIPDILNVSNKIKTLKNRYSENFFPLLFVGNHYPSIDLKTVILGTKILNKELNIFI